MEELLVTCLQIGCRRRTCIKMRVESGLQESELLSNYRSVNFRQTVIGRTSLGTVILKSVKVGATDVLVLFLALALYLF